MKFIDSRAALAELGPALSGAPRLFLDTEFESNRSGTELCLLQVSRGEEVFLVDAVALGDLSSLAGAFADAGLWVLHAGQQDVELVSRRLGLVERPELFDTQIAWAMLSVEHSVSLAYAQYRALGVRGKKTHQADDWLRRPLSASQLAYAAADIDHLPALHAELEARARRLGRLEWIIEASAEAAWPEPATPQRLGIDSFRNAWQLDAPSQAALRFLIDWFNGLPSEARSSAPEPKTLLSIASRLPRRLDDLMRIKGVPRRLPDEWGSRLVAGLTRAAAGAATAEFQPIEPEPYATEREIRLDGWLSAARAEVCARLGVAPELALPARVLRGLKAEALARGALDFSSALGGFRGELLAESLARFAVDFPLQL